MKIDMTLGLRDVPGSLIGALEPISGHGGNILSVFHLRNEGELVPVQITFRVVDQSSLDLIKNALEEQNMHISEIKVEGKKYYEKRSITFMLHGHVIDTDIQDTIDRINAIGMVSDIDVVMPSPEEKSSVMVHVDVDEEKSESLSKMVEDICCEKEFLLIGALD